MTAHPISAATEAGTRAGKGRALLSATTAWPAKQPSSEYVAMGPSAPRMGEGPVVRRPAAMASSASWQRIGRSTRQWAQAPQPGARLSTTGWSTDTLVTFVPTA